MTAYEIMSDHAEWITQYRTAWNCDYATRDSTDDDDWLESWVLYEGTLTARGFVEEVMK